jgi:hypothetical protein
MFAGTPIAQVGSEQQAAAAAAADKDAALDRDDDQEEKHMAVKSSVRGCVPNWIALWLLPTVLLCIAWCRVAGCYRDSLLFVHRSLSCAVGFSG